ncbi:hypothetical protein CROQUDRAFT_661897 [Cronartium quercuum f. sp. fusiforme G11]|uniref:HhH-GPD domain-containing protein n=1 Tax=Cronartium quercuum f. sp. fusiforme G11 TaxID=708437 RepID=A0A9P6T8E8_9BASI|nr:hypothetical protein CROQUDRAFT_661897 [Cronartium quercuum f. sp. fusiforme G11]
MPVTRSSSALRSTSTANAIASTPQPAPPTEPKRKPSQAVAASVSKKPKQTHAIGPETLRFPPLPSVPCKAKQSAFKLEDANAHLIAVDPRFAKLFDQLVCKPFQPDQFETNPNPFESLCKSILGQQVSWLAARSITHKFIRLFFPELPEKADAIITTPKPFPSPAQVSACSIDRLRSAGASQRKAEYLLDLSARFVDGRLSSEKLLEMNPDQIMEELCAVRGIGRWTVEMFLIFTIKHPDILPCSDLGIQKGLLRWYTSTLPPPSPKKKQTPKTPEPEGEVKVLWTQLPAPNLPSGSSLTMATMKARLVKPIKVGLYLTPKEMEELTEPWKPFRSIAVWYLWSLTDSLAAPL